VTSAACSSGFFSILTGSTRSSRQHGYANVESSLVDVCSIGICSLFVPWEALGLVIAGVSPDVFNEVHHITLSQTGST
jgi:hypothetical protein